MRTLVELHDPLRNLVTHEFDLAQVVNVFRCADDKSIGAIKVAVQIA